MKKHSLKISLLAVIAAVAGYGAYQAQAQNNGLSEIALANVEALATGEEGGTCRWQRVFDGNGCPYWVCVANGNGNLCVCGETKG